MHNRVIFIFTANKPGRWRYLCNRYVDSYTGIFKNILGFILGYTGISMWNLSGHPVSLSVSGFLIIQTSLQHPLFDQEQSGKIVSKFCLSQGKPLCFLKVGQGKAYGFDSKVREILKLNVVRTLYKMFFEYNFLFMLNILNSFTLIKLQGWGNVLLRCSYLLNEHALSCYKYHQKHENERFYQNIASLLKSRVAKLVILVIFCKLMFTRHKTSPLTPKNIGLSQLILLRACSLIVHASLIQRSIFSYWWSITLFTTRALEADIRLCYCGDPG